VTPLTPKASDRSGRDCRPPNPALHEDVRCSWWGRRASNRNRFVDRRSPPPPSLPRRGRGKKSAPRSSPAFCRHSSSPPAPRRLFAPHPPDGRKELRHQCRSESLDRHGVIRLLRLVRRRRGASAHKNRDTPLPRLRRVLAARGKTFPGRLGSPPGRPRDAPGRPGDALGCPKSAPGRPGSPPGHPAGATETSPNGPAAFARAGRHY